MNNDKLLKSLEDELVLAAKLGAVYTSIKRKFVPCILKLREDLGDGRGKWKHSDFISLFSHCDGWTITISGGHCLCQCDLTGMKLGFSTHDARDLSVGIRTSLLRDLQMYCNIFSNYVFEIQSWHAAAPDFLYSVNRLRAFHANKAHILEQVFLDSERTIGAVGSKVSNKRCRTP
ncbi:MAG: hypothetical protein VX112_04330 [Pseudomonadota bacterium]|nr:hypothetical protein [Pseudomonadota bacterium]